MPGATLRLVHPCIPGLIATQDLSGTEYERYKEYRSDGHLPIKALSQVTLFSDSVVRLIQDTARGKMDVRHVVCDVHELPPDPESRTSRMIMHNDLTGTELVFDMTADEMSRWQNLRASGVNQYEALLTALKHNEPVRERIRQHQRDAAEYLKQAARDRNSIVARPRGERRVVPVTVEEEDMSSTSTSTSTAVAKPSEMELLKKAAACVKEVVASQAFKDFAALTLQFAKVHFGSSEKATADSVSIKVPQVDKTGAPAKPVEAGKLGSLAHALALIQALPLPKALKQRIADATSVGRVPTTPDALSAARSLVQSQLVKKPGSPLAAAAAGSPSPPAAAASPSVVEQVAEQQAVAAAVGKKRKTVDRTPAQSPVAAVATTPEKPASSPKKRAKVVDADLAINDEIERNVAPKATAKKAASPKVRKSASAGASVTSVGGSSDVATELAAGLVGAASGDNEWDHLEAMAH